MQLALFADAAVSHRRTAGGGLQQPAMRPASELRSRNYPCISCLDYCGSATVTHASKSFARIRLANCSAAARVVKRPTRTRK